MDGVKDRGVVAVAKGPADGGAWQLANNGTEINRYVPWQGRPIAADAGFQFLNMDTEFLGNLVFDDPGEIERQVMGAEFRRRIAAAELRRRRLGRRRGRLWFRFRLGRRRGFDASFENAAAGGDELLVQSPLGWRDAIGFQGFDHIVCPDDA